MEIELGKSYHRIINTDGGTVVTWGGLSPNIPAAHSSGLKKSLTSNIKTFDMSVLSWTSVATTGEPPAAVRGYSSCSLGNKIYYFGGNCIPNDCYHNDLFTLDTLSKDWRQVDYISSPTSSPMKKNGHEMASFTVGSEDYLFVFGGYGPTPTPTPSHGQYVLYTTRPNRSYTNEVHMLCVSPTTGQ